MPSPISTIVDGIRPARGFIRTMELLYLERDLIRQDLARLDVADQVWAAYQRMQQRTASAHRQWDTRRSKYGADGLTQAGRARIVQASTKVARPTHCRRGHAFTDDTIYLHRGRARCRLCRLLARPARTRRSLLLERHIA